jgi:hypothetical protein
MRAGGKYLPEVRDVFFVAASRSRRIFTRDASGRVNGFVDRREGEDVRWTRLGEGSHHRSRSISLRPGRPQISDPHTGFDAVEEPSAAAASIEHAPLLPR